MLTFPGAGKGTEVDENLLSAFQTCLVEPHGAGGEVSLVPSSREGEGCPGRLRCPRLPVSSK